MGLFNSRFLTALRDLAVHTAGLEFKLEVHCFSGLGIWSEFRSAPENNQIPGYFPVGVSGEHTTRVITTRPTGNLCGWTLGSNGRKAAYQQTWEEHWEPASPSWGRLLESSPENLLPQQLKHREEAEGFLLYHVTQQSLYFWLPIELAAITVNWTESIINSETLYVKSSILPFAFC